MEAFPYFGFTNLKFGEDIYLYIFHRYFPYVDGYDGHFPENHHLQAVEIDHRPCCAAGSQAPDHGSRTFATALGRGPQYIGTSKHSARVVPFNPKHGDFVKNFMGIQLIQPTKMRIQQTQI